MAQNGKAHWTADRPLSWNSKAPPLPPDPGLYRFAVAEAAPKQVGPEAREGLEVQLRLTQPFGGGDAPQQAKVFHTLGICDKTGAPNFVVYQLAESCNVALPDRTGEDAIQEFCNALLDSDGGIVRIKHGKTQDGQTRAEVAYGVSYLTESEAAAEALGAPTESAPPEPEVKRRGRRATASA